MSVQSYLNDMVRAVRKAELNNGKLLNRFSPFFQMLVSHSVRVGAGNGIEAKVRYKRTSGGFLPTATSKYPDPAEEFSKRLRLDFADYVGVMQVTGKSIRSTHSMTLQQILDRDSLSSLPESLQEALASEVNDQITFVHEDMKDALSTFAYTGRGADNIGLIGLASIIDDNTSSYGGLSINEFEKDPKFNQSYWQPHLLENSGTLRPLTPKLLAQATTRVWRGERGEEVTAFCDHSVWQALNLVIEPQHRYDSSLRADFGFNAIKYGPVNYVHDEVCPPNSIYYVNWNNLWLAVRECADFDNFEGWEKLPGYDVIRGAVHVELQIVCNDRFRMCKLADIAGVND